MSGIYVHAGRTPRIVISRLARLRPGNGETTGHPNNGVETMTTIELHYAYPTSGIGMAAAAVASPLGIGASNAAGAKADACLLAMVEEAGALDYRKSHRRAEKIAQYDRLNVLFGQIETTPATTLQGVAAKLRCLDRQMRSGQVTPLEFVSSALADLDRLAGKV